MKRIMKKILVMLMTGVMLTGMTGCLEVELEDEGAELTVTTAEKSASDEASSAETSSEASHTANLLETTAEPESTLTTAVPETSQIPETTKTPVVTETPTVSERKALTIKVDGIIDQGDRKVIALGFDNQTGSSVLFFTANAQCVLQVTTDSGVYDTPVDETHPIHSLAAGRSYRTITTEYAPGEVKRIVLTLVYASFDTIENVEIYHSEKGISSCVCDFADKSVRPMTAESAKTVIPERNVQPQNGKLLIRVDGFVDQGSIKTIGLSFDNRMECYTISRVDKSPKI